MWKKSYLWCFIAARFGIGGSSLWVDDTGRDRDISKGRVTTHAHDTHDLGRYGGFHVPHHLTCDLVMRQEPSDRMRISTCALWRWNNPLSTPA
jgi:hypothetical protein